MLALQDFATPELTAFCQHWKIVEFSVFGSAARREMRDGSDIDVMVTFGGDESWDLMDLGLMTVELEAMFGRPVDLVERGTIKNPFRLRTIMDDLTVVYAA